MLSKLRRRAEDEKGFTLIELLVVVLIIGILAAIAIPAFLGQRSKAQDAESKASTKSAQTAIESYATDYDGKYTNASEAELLKIEPTLNDANGLKVVPGADTYTVSTKSPSKYGTTFSITRTSDGKVTRKCDKPGDGGCRSDSTW